MSSTNCFFSVRDLQYTEVTNGYHITVTTDIPVHLYFRWSNVKPQIHIHPLLKRGIQIRADPYLCFVSYHDNEQEESGDTLEHTFIKIPWLCCETRYFHFWGKVAGQVCRSTTALFTKKSTIPTIITLDALGISGYVFSNESSYSATRDAWTGTVVDDTNTGTIGQAKEGTQGFYIWRGSLFFDISAIPKDGKIISQRLKFIVQHGGVSSAINDPDQCLTVLYYPDIIAPPIQPHHFGYIGQQYQDIGHITPADWLVGGHASTAYINVPPYEVVETKKRFTRFALRGSHDINNIPDEGFIERNRYDFQLPKLSQTGWQWLEVTWLC